MKNTINKTIPFKPRSSNSENDDKIAKLKNKNITSSKVIPYPKRKKKKEKNINFIKSHRFVFILLFLILFFSLIFFIDNTILDGKVSPSGRPLISKSINVNNSLTKDEFKFYSRKLKTQLVKYLDLDSDYKISISSMHKNGDSIYTKGSVNIDYKDTKYFDAIIKNEVISSIIVDGSEYIK